MPAGLTEAQQKQLTQVDTMLDDSQQLESFAKNLFFGRFSDSEIMPFPELSEEREHELEQFLGQVESFCERGIDGAAIEKEASIPSSVIRGLGELGVLNMTADDSLGGKEMELSSFCRVMQVLGSACSSTAALVGIQHSAGLTALELFGSQEQKVRWYNDIAKGEKTIAFALTEPMAGSDINNVRTRAEPDGESFRLTGEKRWISNAAGADVLIVMARTPDHAQPDGAVTAFLVPADTAGIKITDQQLQKIGVNGIATGNFLLDGVSVDVDDVLGQMGDGMEVANTVLAHLRLAASAASAGAVDYCLDQMVQRASERRQFGMKIGKFGLVREKIANAAAESYAIQSAHRYLAKLLSDSPGNYELEAAMVKVFSSECLWRVVNDCLQIWGGAGVFTDQPFERMVRDARVNLIGDCANDALRSFIAMVGLRHVARDLVDEDAGLVGSITKKIGVISESLTNPNIAVKHEHLRFFARVLSKQIGQFSWQVKMALSNSPNVAYTQQHLQGRLANVAIELFVASCVFSRISSVLVNGTLAQSVRDIEFDKARLYLRTANRRIEIWLEEIKSNCDTEVDAVANQLLGETA